MIGSVNPVPGPSVFTSGPPPQRKPVINGRRYSFASIELDVGTLYVLGVKSINYRDSLKPGIIRGTGPRKLGRTPGQYEASMDFEAYRAEADAIRRYIAAGTGSFGTKVFQITVTYAEPENESGQGAAQVVTDIINGCRITDQECKGSEGSEPSSVVFTCDVMLIAWGGEGGEVLDGTIAASATEQPGTPAMVGEG